jgi:very-short-patch-repair endonuclease
MPAETATVRHIGLMSRSRGPREEDRARGDAGIAELAERQHGVVSRRQLLDLGFGSDAIQNRVESHRLHPLHPGVYAVGHRVVPRQGRWRAALFASGEGAVLSHWSAAALWGIRPNSRSIIDVTNPHKSRSWAEIKRHHSALPADEATAADGIPVTTVPRTILDLAATEPVETVASMLKEAEYRRLYDPLSLWDLVDRYPGRRGVRRARLALARLKEEPPGRRRSRLEERFGPFLRRHRVPLPRFNDWIVLGDRRFQVDCHWPGTAQIVELDGWEGHGTRSAFREDRARDRALRVAGYSVTRLTWAQLEDEPAAIAADLRTLLTTRAPASAPAG